MRHWLFVSFAALAVLQNAHGQSADWPQPRHDGHLTAVQPMPGGIKGEPKLIGAIDLGRTKPDSVEIERGSGQRARIAIVGGELRCYDENGKRLWASHPTGLNFTTIVGQGDFEANGEAEIVLQAGRPAQPFGAAVIVSASDGHVLFRHDVEPMSYAWTLHLFDDATTAKSHPTKQMLVVMQGYPPDAKNGYCAMFAPSAGGWKQKWRYDFSQYTCFPNVFETDLDGDGLKEIAMISHSRMWVLDERDGAVKQFLQWDTAPANVRSYGLNQFVDLNGDGKIDFLCLGRFSKHYEVLLNDGGKLREAWHYGWAESVMTGKVALTWPEPAIGDVDGDGRLDVIVSMFNATGDGAWSVRVHDAVDGKLKYTFPGVIAARLIDLGGGGRAILCDRSDDASDATSDGGYTIHQVKSAAVLKVVDGKLKTIWERESARAIREASGPGRVQVGDQTFTLGVNDKGGVTANTWTAPKSALTPAINLPDDAPVAAMPEMLAADLLGEGRSQILLYRNDVATLWKFADGKFVRVAEYPSSALPMIADLDGDGKLELVLVHAAAGQQARFKAITPALHDCVLWEVELPPANRTGLPQPRVAYLRPGHFTGRKQPDIYAWIGTPIVRSLVLRGDTGAVVSEKGQIGQTERYWGPTHNLTSVHDVNGDGKEDLVFTDPDEYCVASGATGDFLVGPLDQPTLFHQPSQGLYTMPVILGEGAAAKVCLCGGHYFRAMLSADGKKPGWFALPVVGEARCDSEAFLQTSDGSWLMGFGRQNGQFACLSVADGSQRWNMEIGASCSDPAVCDIDGDGRQEFIFGTSHGMLYAVGDEDRKPHVLWNVQLDAGLGAPILADIDGDGKSDIVIPAEDGTVRVFGAGR